MQQQLISVDQSGKLLISKQGLLLKGVFSECSYRKTKSLRKLVEVMDNGTKYVQLDSLTRVSQDKVIRIFSKLKTEYANLLTAMGHSGEDCAHSAVEFTADLLEINEPFIKASIDSYMNSHYALYSAAYMDLGLHSNSVKGYAKQCALVQWIFDFVQKIKQVEGSAKRCEVMLRSFRVNLQAALAGIELEVKVPLSDSRYHKWVDEILKQMEAGKKPEDIVQVKRQSNFNAGKVTQEQLNIALFWQINGTNMSVSTVYKKWLTYAAEQGWWTDEDGVFNPPTEARLYQLLAPYKNANYLEKTDAIQFRANIVPSVSRLLPDKKNHVWVIDGTAHNENVDHKGKVRQHLYCIKVVDVATLRMVGVANVIGVKEPFYAVKEAIQAGIVETGYKPAIIQCDRGPAWKELESWCESNDIKLYPSITGNARAKTIENLFYQFDNDITRYLKGYSGQNRTALGVNSHASEKRESAGKRNARSASIVMNWVKGEGITAWNERVIETLEGKKCKKTPYELWKEKPSYVPEMRYEDLCRMCGTPHEKKLTIAGLEIEHKTDFYCYFPPFRTSAEREKAEKIFMSIPREANTANRLTIYLLKGGDPAAVYTHDGKFLGVWVQKPRTAFIAETKEEKQLLDDYMALQYRITEHAKAVNFKIKEAIGKRPDAERIEQLGNEMLTGKRRKYEGFGEAAKRWAGRYDKSELLEEEVEAKATIAQSVSTREGATCAPKFYEWIDPDTNERHWIEK